MCLIKYRDHYISNIIVAAPVQHCNYYVHVHVIYDTTVSSVHLNPACNLKRGLHSSEGAGHHGRVIPMPRPCNL